MISFTSQWQVSVHESKLNNKTMQKRLDEMVKASPGGSSRSTRIGKNYQEAFINLPDSKDTDVISLVNKYHLPAGIIGDYDPDLKVENVKKKPCSLATGDNITPEVLEAYAAATRNTEK